MAVRDGPELSEQLCGDPSALQELLDMMERGAARVIETAVARRGHAEPLVLYQEAALAVLRAMPPLLGPANAMVRDDRQLRLLAGALGLHPADVEGVDSGLPRNQIMTPKVLAGGYELRWEGDLWHQWHKHGVVFDVDPGADPPRLRGVVLIDRGIGPEARVPGPDEDLHILAVLPDVPTHAFDLRFGVTVGAQQPLRYDFALEWSQGEWDLVGTVVINLGEARRATGRWLPTVPGVKSDWPHLPSWEEIARRMPNASGTATSG